MNTEEHGILSSEHLFSEDGDCIECGRWRSEVMDAKDEYIAEANAALAEVTKTKEIFDTDLGIAWRIIRGYEQMIKDRDAALAEAVKGLERIAAPESEAGMMAARDTLARIEALTDTDWEAADDANWDSLKRIAAEKRAVDAALAEAVARLTQEAEYREQMADAPTDESWSAQTNEVYEKLFRDFADFCRATLARIEALTVQPEVAQ